MDHHNHANHQHETKSNDLDLCIVENRDVEASSQLETLEIANHVWETCKPGSKFMIKSPTVSVRRIQLMRAQLQFNPRAWEDEPSTEKTTQKKPLKCPKIRIDIASDGKVDPRSSKSNSIITVMHACEDECMEPSYTDKEKNVENDDDDVGPVPMD